MFIGSGLFPFSGPCFPSTRSDFFCESCDGVADLSGGSGSRFGPFIEIYYGTCVARSATVSRVVLDRAHFGVSSVVCLV